jgi:DMSO/TMAO reductase YedYZ molybdopterin-dependent catalytic subunit
LSLFVDKCKVSMLVLTSCCGFYCHHSDLTASIPLKQAADPAADVLLAYEMNGEVIQH